MKDLGPMLAKVAVAALIFIAVAAAIIITLLGA